MLQNIKKYFIFQSITLLIASTHLLANAYSRDQPYRMASRSSKSHIINTKQEAVSQLKNAEARHKSSLEKKYDFLEDSNQQTKPPWKIRYQTRPHHQQSILQQQPRVNYGSQDSDPPEKSYSNGSNNPVEPSTAYYDLSLSEQYPTNPPHRHTWLPRQLYANYHSVDSPLVEKSEDSSLPAEPNPTFSEQYPNNSPHQETWHPIPHVNPNYGNVNDGEGYSAHEQHPKGYSAEMSDLTPKQADTANDDVKSLDHQHNNEDFKSEISTEQNMQSSSSESKNLPDEEHESLPRQEHDGFLDMGAYADKLGSFGWYADFPVGKEHDKVTYSFS